MITDLTLNSGEWVRAWSHFDPADPNHLEAIELLRRHILQSDPCLLARNAEWHESLCGACKI